MTRASSTPATAVSLPPAEFWRVKQLSSHLGGLPIKTLYKWVERYPDMPVVVLPSCSARETFTKTGKVRKTRTNYLFPIAKWKAWFRSMEQGRALKLNGTRDANSAGQGAVRNSGDLTIENGRHSTTRTIRTTS